MDEMNEKNNFVVANEEPKKQNKKKNYFVENKEPKEVKLEESKELNEVVEIHEVEKVEVAKEDKVENLPVVEEVKPVMQETKPLPKKNLTKGTVVHIGKYAAMVKIGEKDFVMKPEFVNCKVGDKVEF